MERDVPSVVLFGAILHRLGMAFNEDGYGFRTSREARTCRIYKIQHFSREVEYLMYLFRKERSRSVGARARTRYIFDRYQIHCRSLLPCTMAMDTSQIAVTMLLQQW